MSTVAQLPASAKFLTGDQNPWQGTQDGTNREETMTWLVPWEDSNAFYNTVVGTLTTISYGSGSNGAPTPSISRRIPLQHPYAPTMYATKLAWQWKDGARKPTGAPVRWCKISVTFGYLPYNVTSDSSQGGQNTQTGYPPFMKLSGKSSVRSITDTSKKYTYTNPNGTSQQTTQGVLNQNVAVQFGGISYQVTLFCIPNLAAWQALMDPLKGTVNSMDLVLGAFSQPAGTVLLEGYGFEEDIDVMGNVRWTGTIDLNCSSLPWNSTFVTGSACKLSPAPYKTADHNQIYY